MSTCGTGSSEASRIKCRSADRERLKRRCRCSESCSGDGRSQALPRHKPAFQSRRLSARILRGRRRQCVRTVCGTASLSTLIFLSPGSSSLAPNAAWNFVLRSSTGKPGPLRTPECRDRRPRPGRSHYIDAGACASGTTGTPISVLTRSSSTSSRYGSRALASARDSTITSPATSPTRRRRNASRSPSQDS